MQHYSILTSFCGKPPESIRGHVLQFPCLAAQKKLCYRLEAEGHNFEWDEIGQDPEALRETVIEEKCNQRVGRVSV